MTLVDIEEFTSRFPRRLTSFERDRAQLLLQDAADEITAAFAREHRNLTTELTRHKWLPPVARRVVREMTAAAILVGDQAGKRQAQTTAGMVSESSTWFDVTSVSWGEPVLSDAHRRDLGLAAGGYARGSFPPAPRWPERRL